MCIKLIILYYNEKNIYIYSRIRYYLLIFECFTGERFLVRLKFSRLNEAFFYTFFDSQMLRLRQIFSNLTNTRSRVESRLVYAS